MSAILLVIADAAAPTTGDALLRGYLEGLGHVVTYRSDETAEDVTGFAGVVLSESCVGATLGAKYALVAVPVISHEAAIVDDMLMITTAAANTDAVATDIEIVVPTHPIASGPFGSYSGQIAVNTANGIGYVDSDFYGALGGGVTLVGRQVFDTTETCILAVDSGGALTSGVAAAKRGVVLFSRDLSVPTLTATGTNIIKNAYVWAFGNPRPFPATPVLDPFTRANEDPITVNWTTPLYSGDGTMRLNSNAISASVDSLFSDAYYDLRQFGPDCEIYATITVAPTTGHLMNLHARLKDVGTSGVDGYEFYIDSGGMALQRIVNNVETVLATNSTVVANGEKIGIRCIGSTIEGWHYTGGSWILRMTAIDSTHGGAGYAGVQVSHQQVVIDDFGGGNAPSSGDDPPMGTSGRGAGW